MWPRGSKIATGNLEWPWPTVAGRRPMGHAHATPADLASLPLCVDLFGQGQFWKVRLMVAGWVQPTELEPGDTAGFTHPRMRWPTLPRQTLAR